jgi:hypothetical protein
MMEKLLSILLIFGMTSAASAAISLGGAVTVIQGDSATVTVISDTTSRWMGYIGFDPAVVGVTACVATSNAGSDSYVIPDPYGWIGFYEIAASDLSAPFDSVVAGVQFNITVFGGGASGDLYRIDLYASDWLTILDTAVVEVVLFGGSLQVIISPQAAIDAGAKWRVDGGAWRNSSYTETNLGIGSHTVEYSTISGWNKPANETIQINAGLTTTTSGTYVQQTGSLQVIISPQAAIDAGAKWRVDGVAWRDSGYTETLLTVGSHTVEYNAISSWITPPNETIYIYEDQTTTTSGTYGMSIAFVDADATTGANNGSRWTDAYLYLQDALSEANSNPAVNEILVSEGMYKPDADTANPTGTGNREAAFQLINGVTIKGGYAGFGEPDPNACDIDLYETILSGDLNGDDGPDFVNNGENSYHVVTGRGTNDMTILDGFTITGGNANGSSPDNYGGGMYNEDSNSTIARCTFRNNAAIIGGGMYNDNGSLTVTNCTFIGNSAQNAGGMYNLNDSTPALNSCIFTGNNLEYNGSGMISSQSAPKLTNCTFNRNSAKFGQCGGIFLNRSSPTMTNCILWGNTDSGLTDESAQIYLFESNPVVNYCCVQGWTGSLGGAGNIGDNPLFRDVNGPDNIAGNADDDLHLSAGSPCIDVGDNNTPSLSATDLDGYPRILDGDCNETAVVDMGAYEFNYAYMGDLDYNCRVNFFDFSIFGRAWETKAGEPGWDWACDISDPPDDYIDWRDVTILCDNWLASIGP